MQDLEASCAVDALAGATAGLKAHSHEPGEQQLWDYFQALSRVFGLLPSKWLLQPPAPSQHAPAPSPGPSAATDMPLVSSVPCKSLLICTVPVCSPSCTT